MTYEALPLRLDQHRGALASLWRESMSDPRISDVVPDRMRWLYEENPGGPALTWVALVSGSEDVIGCGSFLPRTFSIGGQTLSGGLLADFAVAKKHRVAGAAIAIQRAVANGRSSAGARFLYGYPNAKSIAIFDRLGYRRIGASSRWVKPLRSAAAIGRRTKSRALVRVASTVVDAGLAIADGALSLALARSYETVELAHPDARFDDLWQRARTCCAIAPERSAAYLAWRYGELTTKKHRFFGCFARGGALAGYVVYSVRDDDVAIIEDLFCEDVEATAGAMLVLLSRHLRGAGLDSITCSYVGADSFSRHLRAAGFVRRPEARSMVVLADAEVPRAVFDRRAWLMMDGELDL